MSKYVLDFWMDGYTDESERTKAEKEFIYEQLNFTASSVKLREMTAVDSAAPEMHSLLEEVVNSDMAMREEDEGSRSHLLKRIRSLLKELANEGKNK